MNDNSFDTYSDRAIMREIGAFIRTLRIRENLSQDDVAARAAMSRSTLSLLERGENTAVSNLLKVLRVLDGLYALESFRPIPQIRPMLLAKNDAKRRQRASRKSPKENEEL